MTHRIFHASNVLGTIAFLAMLAAPGDMGGGNRRQGAIHGGHSRDSYIRGMRVPVHQGRREKEVGPITDQSKGPTKDIIMRMHPL